MTRTETIVKVGGKSNPSLIATCIILALKEGKLVKVPCVGDAIRVAAKALALVNKFNANELKLRYEINTDYKIGDRDANDKITVLCFTVYTVEEEQVQEVVKDIDNLETVINSYINKGYRIEAMCPVNKEGHTSEVHIIFNKEIGGIWDENNMGR